MPDTVGLEQREPTSLRGIALRAQTCKDHRFRDLYRCVDAQLLQHCWRDLNKRSASGVDEVTGQAYEQDLTANIDALAERLKTKRYRTKLVRRCYIPKENGGERPLGIPALEDKLVQLACAKLLGSIYEQEFLPVSYGYRPGRGAKDAVCDLGFNLQYGKFGYVVEADIKGFFDTIDHDWLLEMLSLRVDDRAFLNLIRKWLKAGILDTDGQVLHPVTGSPQGGIVSPILANVYLHYATCGSSAWSSHVAAVRLFSSVMRMISSAPSSISTMPSGSTECYQSALRSSGCRSRRRRPASFVSAATTLDCLAGSVFSASSCIGAWTGVANSG